MTNLKTIANTLAVVFGIGFVDGFLGLGLSDDLYIFLGLVQMLAIASLLVKVYKK